MKTIHPAIAGHAMEENEKLRGLLEAALFYVPNAGLRSDISAALSRQAEPECRCTMRQRLVGDGCSVCNPEYAADHEAEPCEPAPAQSEQPVNVPEGWLIELGFDVLDRTSRSVESKSHTPTIKVIFPPCEPVDSSAWDLRDEVARRIGSVLATPAMAAKDRP